MSLPPQTLKMIDLPGPASSPDDVVPRFIPSECPADPERPPISLAWRVMAPPERGLLQFDRVSELRPQDPSPTPVGRATYVEYLKTDLEAMGGLEIPAFAATAHDGKLDFKVSLRNRGEKRPKPLFLELEVGSIQQSASELTELRFDISNLDIGRERTIEGSVAVKTYGGSTAVRIYRIRRDALSATARKAVKM